MVAEPTRDQIPEWDGQANTLERFEEDVLIFTHAVPKDRKVTLGPKLLQTVSKGFSTERNRLGTSEVRCVATAGRCYSAIETHSAASRKRLATGCFRTLQTFSPSFRPVCIYNQCNITLQKNQNLHERALQAVKSVTTSSKTETKTETDSKEKEIIADVLRGFLLLENAALTGSEQVFVLGVAGKCYAYNHIANALRETWCNDERLRSHDSTLSQQLQSGLLAGGVHRGHPNG